MFFDDWLNRNQTSDFWVRNSGCTVIKINAFSYGHYNMGESIRRFTPPARRCRENSCCVSLSVLFCLIEVVPVVP
jgi:hypothetical protein